MLQMYWFPKGVQPQKKRPEKKGMTGRYVYHFLPTSHTYASRDVHKLSHYVVAGICELILPVHSGVTVQIPQSPCTPISQPAMYQRTKRSGTAVAGEGHLFKFEFR